MPRHERSAGFILYRRDPAAPEGRVYLLLDYGRHWDYVKGHVEQGEDDRQAAVRELKEETGIGPPRFVDGFAHVVEYYFRSNRHGLIHKTVAFFLGETDARDVILSEEHVGAAFLPYEAAMARLTYATARDLLKNAHEFLTSRAAAPDATSV
jgi:bis(5'-nucleosidyl)-tetraphosphatase